MSSSSSSNMLRKKEAFTVITPIPGFIPRQLAIDILHSHSEVITLNPLVLDHKPIKPPRNAPSDEYYSTWYEITERIQYIPGLGRMGSGKISFNGCFHDMPWGLQTHIYAPMNVDLKNRYRIAGNQPGVEPPETQEIGLASLGAPSDGLYLRDDVEIKCNVAVVGFVKSQLKAASKDMVSRIIKKAELLDAGVLHAMIENGKLKTVNPHDRSTFMGSAEGSRASPGLQHSPTFPDGSNSNGPTPYQIPRPVSVQQGQYNNNDNRPGGQNRHWSAPYGGIHHSASVAKHNTLPVQAELPDPGGNTAPVEMPGDYAFPQQPSPRLPPPQPSPTYPPSEHESTVSNRSSRATPQPQGSQSNNGDWRSSYQSQYSQYSNAGHSLSRPTSTQSNLSSGGAAHSPGLTSMPIHEEAPDEQEQHAMHVEALRRLDPATAAGRAQYYNTTRTTSTPPPQKQRPYAYNPADYATVGGRDQAMRSHSHGGYTQ